MAGKDLLVGVIIGLCLLAVLPGAEKVGAAELKPFATDGCSLFPDGTPEDPELWLSCCVEHDRLYWRGGTRQERKAADEKLRQCVASLGAPKVSALMKFGVRLGGGPYLPAPFRWGFGWPYPRGYGPLTPDELRQVERLSEGQTHGKPSGK